MMVRPIRRAELDRFTRLSDPVDNNALGAHVDRALRAGESSLRWCLVADDGNSIAGRAYLWHRPGNPVFVHFFDVDWSRPDWHHIGSELIGAVANAASEQASDGLLYALDVPHSWHSEPERRAVLFTQAGFRLVRQGLRWERYADSAPVRQVGGRLELRTLAEVGDDAFRDAIARVSDGTLDGRMQEMRARLGRDRDADEHFRLLSGIASDPSEWQLGYDADGRLIGLVVAGGAAEQPVIALVGVLPQHRGHGYVDELLAAAVASLESAGARVIRADTDVANVPMANAFLRAGFRQFMSRAEYLLLSDRGC